MLRLHRRPPGRQRPGVTARGAAHVLPRLGRLRDDRRSAQHVQRGRRPRDRLASSSTILIGYPLDERDRSTRPAFGPELVAASWTDFWIWYVGPLAGGAIAALLYDELYLRPRHRRGPPNRRHSTSPASRLAVSLPRRDAKLSSRAHSSSGLGHRPLTAAARVRIPYAPFTPPGYANPRSASGVSRRRD